MAHHADVRAELAGTAGTPLPASTAAASCQPTTPAISLHQLKLPREERWPQLAAVPAAGGWRQPMFRFSIRFTSNHSSVVFAMLQEEIWPELALRHLLLDVASQFRYSCKQAIRRAAFVPLQEKRAGQSWLGGNSCCCRLRPRLAAASPQERAEPNVKFTSRVCDVTGGKLAGAGAAALPAAGGGGHGQGARLLRRPRPCRRRHGCVA